MIPLLVSLGWLALAGVVAWVLIGDPAIRAHYDRQAAAEVEAEALRAPPIRWAS